MPKKFKQQNGTLTEYPYKNYKAYLKYVGQPRVSTVRGKTFYHWDTGFTPNERACMKSEFHEEDTENIMVIVCTTANFDYTEFAVVPVSDELNCMGDDEINKHRRISVKRQKNGKSLRYYGTAISDINAKKLINCDSYFGFDQN